MIKNLCQKDPNERWGYQKGGVDDIRHSKWFSGFDWEGFKKQRIPAPLIPQCRDPMSVAKNASKFKPAIIPKETSGWDADF